MLRDFPDAVQRLDNSHADLCAFWHLWFQVEKVEKEIGMSDLSRRWDSVASCIVLLAVSGCGGRDEVALGRVEGVVKLDGQPLAGATVTVIPNVGRPSQALTDAEGRYALKYTPRNPGVLIGTHPIRVDPQHKEPEGAENLSPQAYEAALKKLAEENPVPKEWRDGSTKITVEAGSQEFNIDMVSKQ